MKQIFITITLLFSIITSKAQIITFSCSKIDKRILNDCFVKNPKIGSFAEATTIISKLKELGKYSNNITYFVPCNNINTFIAANTGEDNIIFYPKNSDIFEKLAVNDNTVIKDFFHALSHLKEGRFDETSVNATWRNFMKIFCKANGTIETFDNIKYEWSNCELKDILPDSDTDGVNDAIDKCPQIKGTNFDETSPCCGCPDLDCDGILDNDDKCPNLKGTNSNKNSSCYGCPDLDCDEVIDTEDKCPNQKGTNLDKNSSCYGCPDLDCDEVIDTEDRCRETKGTNTKKTSPCCGCPDFDCDGVLDKDDKCPFEYAVPNGCPSYDFEVELGDGVKIPMIYVEGGEYVMGCTEEKQNCSDDKAKQFVKVSSFYIGKFEITQQQWQYIMGTNPSKFKNCETCPVENIDKKDMQSFLLKLKQKTGKNYRIPTEAEWEYAARGGKKTKNYTYAGSNDPNVVAWHWDNSKIKSNPIGLKQANELGIYDMSGNVWEWCIIRESKTDFSSLIDSRLVLRGGSWKNNVVFSRVICRYDNFPTSSENTFGFRLCIDY